MAARSVVLVFYLTRDRNGIGRLIGEDVDNIQLEIFHSIGDIEHRWVPRKNALATTLPEKTRVYVHSPEDNCWKVGRIGLPNGDHFADIYTVHLDGSQTASMVRAENLWVCSLSRPKDPTEALATGFLGTSARHEARRTFLKWCILARSRHGGLTSILSSSVDRIPHQLSVVRQVLEDPIQRYLLADEVGLGKTIEAGAIIRQWLSDEPNIRVLVVAPDALVHQWQSHLRRLFALRDFSNRQVGDGDIQIAPFSRLASLAGGAPGVWNALVVDEAHSLIPANSTPEESFREPGLGFLKKVSADGLCERVLLLSATPIIGNEPAAFSLLHLLDPVENPLDAYGAFAERVSARIEIVKALSAVDESLDRSLLVGPVRRLLSLLGPDETAIRLSQDVLEGSLSASERSKRVLEFRSHVSAAHDLHHRMVRTRRDIAERYGNWPSRQGDVAVLEDASDEAARIASLVERWRRRATGRLNAIEPYGSYDQGEAVGLAQWFVRLLTAVASSADAIVEVVSVRLSPAVQEAFEGERDFLREFLDAVGPSDGRAPASARGVPPPLTHGGSLGLRALLSESPRSVQRQDEHSSGLRSSPVFPQAAPTDCPLDVSKAGVAVSAVIEMVGRRGGHLEASGSNPEASGSNPEARIVVFASSDKIVKLITQELKSRYRNANNIFSVVSNDGGEHVEAAVRGFTEYAPRGDNNVQWCVLVGSRNAEIGLNLQVASGIVHADLPLDINRIEQRIGRLDRYGRSKDGIDTVVVLPGPADDCQAWRDWYHALRDGLEIFKSSVSDLQFINGELQEIVAKGLFWQDSPQDLAEHLKTTVAQWRFNQSMMYENERNAAGRLESARVVADNYNVLDGEAEGIRPFAVPYLTSLGFGMRTGASGEYLLHWDSRVNVPARLWLAISSRAFKWHGEIGVSTPFMFVRRIGAPMLLLPGHPVHDFLDSFVRADDDGTTFAVLRKSRQWSHGPSVFFRLDYVIETSIQQVLDDAGLTRVYLLRALERRADALLPPSFHSLYFDDALNLVEDESVRALLELPPGATGSPDDIDLQSSREQLRSYISDDSLDASCRHLSARSAEVLRTQPGYVSNLRQRTSDAMASFAVAERRLTYRHAVEGRDDRTRDERLYLDLLRKAVVDDPLVRLDAIGVNVLCGTE